MKVSSFILALLVAVAAEGLLHDQNNTPTKETKVEEIMGAVEEHCSAPSTGK